MVKARYFGNERSADLASRQEPARSNSRERYRMVRLPTVLTLRYPHHTLCDDLRHRIA